MPAPFRGEAAVIRTPSRKTDTLEGSSARGTKHGRSENIRARLRLDSDRRGTVPPGSGSAGYSCDGGREGAHLDRGRFPTSAATIARGVEAGPFRRISRRRPTAASNKRTTGVD